MKKETEVKGVHMNRFQSILESTEQEPNHYQM